MVGKVPADHPLRQSRKSRDFLYTVKKGFFKKGRKINSWQTGSGKPTKSAFLSFLLWIQGSGLKIESSKLKETASAATFFIYLSNSKISIVICF
jgi:hypothetical protein